MSLNDQLLCVANDGGDVALLDKNSMIERHKWTAHYNAIFDVKWRYGIDHHLGTASGDKSIIIWDTNTRKLSKMTNNIKFNRQINSVQKVYSYDCAHNGSIKSIDFKDENIMASGSRDGLLKIWDLRCGRGMS